MRRRLLRWLMAAGILALLGGGSHDAKSPPAASAAPNGPARAAVSPQPSPAGLPPARQQARPAAAASADDRPRLVVQAGQNEQVASVAFSPDGEQVLTGSADGAARLWDANSAGLIRSFEEHGGRITSVAFSSDGTRILTGSDDKTAKLREIRSGKLIHQFLHSAAIRSVALSRDGKYVLTGGDDKTARLWWDWDSAGGAKSRAFVGHADRVNSVAFSPDGTRVLTGSDDKTARLWNASSGMEIHRFPHPGVVRSVAFSPHGEQVLTGCDDALPRLWNADSGALVRKFKGHTGQIYSVAFSHDGTRVLSGSGASSAADRDNTARLWDVASGKQLQVFAGHRLWVNSVAFSPDDKLVLTGSDDETARLWDAESGICIRQFAGHADPVYSVAFSPAGSRVLAGSGDGVARLWNAAGPNGIVVLEGHADAVNSVAFSPDGKQVLTGSEDQTARLWRDWDAAGGVKSGEIARQDGPIDSVAFSPDGKLVLTGGGDATARLWDIAANRQIQKFVGHTLAINSVAFSPDGKQVLTGSDDKTARLWDAAGGNQIGQFRPNPHRPGHAAAVNSVAFSFDGRQVLAGGAALVPGAKNAADNAAWLWDKASGEQLRTFVGHRAMVNSVAFVPPDGKQIVTGSADETARLWNAASGEQIRKFEGHAGSVTSVAVSPDGKRLLTGNLAGQSILWDLATGKQLCSLVSFTDGSWAVVDPQGRFDGPNGGKVSDLHWVIGNQPIELDERRYYDPGLFAKYMAATAGRPRNVQAAEKIKIPPAIKLDLQEPRLRVELANRGGGIGRVVVKINGIATNSDARGPHPDPNAASLSLSMYIATDPHLKPGRNTIEVQASDADGGAYVARQIPYVDLRKAPAGGSANVWTLVVGLTRYPEQSGIPDLPYAANDAEAFAGALQTAVARRFGAAKFHLTLLTSPPSKIVPRQPLPMRDNILRAFDQFHFHGDSQSGPSVGPNDIFVVYFAGHAAVDSNMGFHLQTYDTRVTNSDTNPAADISDADLIDATRDIPALNRILILDTCHAGGLIKSDSVALGAVKDSVGFNILAGCTAGEQSYGLPQYDHGVLTYCLLYGMQSGEALKDCRLLDVWTLFDFAADNVPRLSQTVGVQKPQVLTAGSPISLGELTAEDRSSIPLKKVRPTLSLAPLDDGSADRADPLDLTDALRQSLESAAGGRNPPFDFVHCSAGDYRVSGAYTPSADKLTVSLHVAAESGTPEEIVFAVSGDKANLDDLAARIVQEIAVKISDRSGSPQPSRSRQ